MTGKATDGSKPDEHRGGVFVTEGAQLVLRGLTLRLSDVGHFKADPVVVHIGLDTCPHWFEIAAGHVFKAAQVNRELKQAIAEDDNPRIGELLQREFLSGMQAIVAAAVAVDALYAAVRERIDLPEGLIETWRSNRTARHAQIFQVLSRAVEMDEENADAVRGIIRELMKFRGQAVHPAADARAAAYHPDLKQGTEWRFVAFGFPNAQKAVHMAVALVAYVAERPARSSESLQTYLTSLSERVRPHKEKWEEQYGSVFGDDVEA